MRNATYLDAVFASADLRDIGLTVGLRERARALSGDRRRVRHLERNAVLSGVVVTTKEDLEREV
jgi:hypothetical protein